MNTKTKSPRQRPSWDEFWMKYCDLASERGTCDRRYVGAVLVKDNQVLATGYNGSIPGEPHCDDPEIFYQCQRCGDKTTIPTHRADGRGTVCSQSLCGGTTIQQHGGHDMENGHCVRTVHAEINVIAQAAKRGVVTEGATLYCNTKPCWGCFKTILTAGINQIVYRDEYDNQDNDRTSRVAAKIPGFIFRRLPT